MKLYTDADLLNEITLAYRKQAKASVHQHERELATVEAELRKADAAAERYMLAFENGTVTENMFGDRVQGLGAKAKTLRARQ